MSGINELILNGISYDFAGSGGEGGQPTPITLASQMIDTNVIYLYLGSESGYSYGYIYAYVNNVWTKTTLYGKGQDGTATDSQVETYVNEWLDSHPEATTTVADGSITTIKLADGAVTEEKLSSEMLTGVRNTYHDSGDMYDLLAPLEVVSMKKTGKRIKYSSPPVEQNYTGWSIHYFDLSSLKNDSILVGCIAANWSSGFCYYNPSNSTYTALWKNGAGASDWINLSLIPDGCYFCMTCEDTYYTTGYYKYLASLWISPEYIPKYEGLDESISDRAVQLVPNADMGALDGNRPCVVIDMTKYKDYVVRLATTAPPSCTVRLYRTNELTTRGTSISNSYNSSLGNLFPWTYEEKYLVICFVTTNYSVFDNFDILFGWVNPEVARVNKQKRFWGPNLAAHNADSRSSLICACVYADLVDIDVCRTLDGHYVCAHDTTINGHTIAETNLEDLGLTHEQMEITESLEFLKQYGSFCYINFRETTVEQAAALMERIYNVLGRACIYSTFLIDQTSPIYGHAKKFYIWRANQQTMADIVQAGADPSKVYMFGASSGDYTEYDYIRTGSYTMSEVPKDGTVACAFISADPLTAINGWNPS